MLILSQQLILQYKFYHNDFSVVISVQTDFSTDIDECQIYDGGCQGTCVNTVGSYHCLCSTGYELNYDNHTCLDIDECWPNNFNCSHECINLEGAARCGCYLGYNLQDDGKSCIGKVIVI